MLSSCSREHRYAKLLKKEYSESMLDYKQISVSIIDTVFIHNLTDSIASLNSSIESKHRTINRYNGYISEYQENMLDAKRQKRNTYYFLASLYNPIIETYEKMIAQAQDSIASINTRIQRDSLIINTLDSLITVTPEDSITFFVAKHEYDCGGGTISEVVYFNHEDEIYKTKYYEE